MLTGTFEIAELKLSLTVIVASAVLSATKVELSSSIFVSP